MQEVQVKEVARREKGRVFFRFDNGTEFTLYRSEIRGLPQAESTLLMTEDVYLPVSLYEKILTEIVGKRAKKRALFLLERMDRTESQLCEKLRQNGYPEECVAAAVEYVKQYHYIDDLRYAKQYIRYHCKNITALKTAPHEELIHPLLFPAVCLRRIVVPLL